MYRPTYIEVDGNKLENNVKDIKKKYNDYKYFFAVVKNNAYHHGMYAIKYLINGGINYLAVSSLDEALQARKYDSSIPILCLEPIKSEFIYDAINYSVTLTISSINDVENLKKLKLTDDVKVHIKIDSGMNRLGFKSVKEFKKAYDELSCMKHVEVEGIYTHFATSGIMDKHYGDQVEKFKMIISSIDYKKVPIIHADRSLTFVVHDKLEFENGVRLGISLYGYKQNIPEGSFLTRLKRKLKQRKFNIENVHLSNDLSVEYAFSMYSEVIETKNACKGEFCGYGAEYLFEEDTKIAVIACGYSDGVIKNFKYVYINNKPCEIIAECMNMIVVKANSKVKIGDKVEIIGPNQSLKTIGNRLGVNGHRVLNYFSTNVPIVYKYNGEKLEIKY